MGLCSPLSSQAHFRLLSELRSLIKKSRDKRGNFKVSSEMVPEMGLEPIWIAPFDFKSNAYTNSATRACLWTILL